MAGLLTLKNEEALDMVVSRVLRSSPSLVPRALFLGFEAREKRPGDEVGLGHAPVAI